MDPYSDEAVQLYESLKDEGVVNQSALRLARIAGKNVCLDFLKQQLIFVIALKLTFLNRRWSRQSQKVIKTNDLWK